MLTTAARRGHRIRTYTHKSGWLLYRVVQNSVRWRNEDHADIDDELLVTAKVLSAIGTQASPWIELKMR
jgi:hypothetical protein